MVAVRVSERFAPQATRRDLTGSPRRDVRCLNHQQVPAPAAHALESCQPERAPVSFAGGDRRLSERGRPEGRPATRLGSASPSAGTCSPPVERAGVLGAGLPLVRGSLRWSHPRSWGEIVTRTPVPCGLAPHRAAPEVSGGLWRRKGRRMELITPQAVCPVQRIGRPVSVSFGDDKLTCAFGRGCVR